MPRDIPHLPGFQNRLSAFWHSFGHDLAVSAAACGVIALLLLGTAPPSFAQGFIGLIVPAYEEVAVEESLAEEEITQTALADEPVAIASIKPHQPGARSTKVSHSGARGLATDKSSDGEAAGSTSGSGESSASPSHSTSQSGGGTTVRGGYTPSAPSSDSQTQDASGTPQPAPAPAPAPPPAPAPAPAPSGGEDHCADGHGNDDNKSKGCN